MGSLAPANGVRPLPVTSISDHTRQRRILSHAFSDRALREQEYLLQHYSDLLIARLQDQLVQGRAKVDICKWCNFTAFDIIGDLSFGESFHCLDRDENHAWVEAIFRGVKILKMMTAFSHFPPLDVLLTWLIPPAMRAKARESFDWTKQRIDDRLKRRTERPDFLKYIIENNNHKKESMTRGEIDSTVTVLVQAGGGETTSVAISTAIYFALKNPAICDQLRLELGDYPVLTVSALSRLPFLHAVLQEALRIHPPVPLSAARLVDRADVTVCGFSIPQGYRVSIPQKVANRLPSKFAEPDSFLPERWLADRQGRFAADEKAVFEPFLVGPQNCLGKTLAWAEMKLILAKLLWHFDLAFVSGDKYDEDWTDQKAYLVNEKKPLYVEIKPRLIK